jgi:2-polyprenyl-3-methyl-5-hydroxy-6-metoxy-1,4-benzoquinol methylase
MAGVDENWFDGFFEREWLDELAPHDDERTRREADFVVEKLGLEPGARVLDVGCGHGRHAVELARRGFRVTGVDLSPRSIELARQAAAQAEVEVSFVELDARELGFDGEFDAAINLFTSVVGYFDDDAESQRVLDAVARSLRRGGSFLIDTINLLGLARAFRELDWKELESGTIMLERREFDFDRGRSIATWTFLRGGGRRDMTHSLRVYAPHELARMLESAGLDVVGRWGSFEGVDLSFDAWRLIVRGDKR